MAESLQIDANKKQGIQNRSRARQIIDYTDLRRGNIMPSDVDGYLEKDGAFIFIEMKYGNAEMSTGQKLGYMHLVDELEKAGDKAVLFLCRHDVRDTEKDVHSAKSIVTDIYMGGRWRKAKGGTLESYYDRFLAWALPFPEI